MSIKQLTKAEYILQLLILELIKIIQSRFHAYCLIWASKNIIQPSSAFPPLYRDFYRLLIATSIDHWEPRMLYAHLIN